MYRSLFKWPVVCKLSNNASLCVPRQYRKQGTLLFPFLKHTMTNIKYKIFSCKLETSRNTSHQAQAHKKNNLQCLLLFFLGFLKSQSLKLLPPRTPARKRTLLSPTLFTLVFRHTASPLDCLLSGSSSGSRKAAVALCHQALLLNCDYF